VQRRPFPELEKPRLGFRVPVEGDRKTRWEARSAASLEERDSSMMEENAERKDERDARL
jgi:hypothetical protein